MSHSKIIELRKFGKQASGNDFDNNHDLATQQECIRRRRPDLSPESKRRSGRPAPACQAYGEADAGRHRGRDEARPPRPLDQGTTGADRADQQGWRLIPVARRPFVGYFQLPRPASLNASGRHCRFRTHLIRERTGEGRTRAMANGVKFGRKRKSATISALKLSSAVTPARRWPLSPSRTASQSQ